MITVLAAISRAGQTRSQVNHFVWPVRPTRRRSACLAVILVVIALVPNVTSAAARTPDKGAWSSTGSMATGRTGFTATLLPTGRILVAGGSSYNCCSAVASAELYDPRTGRWTPTGSMAVARAYHTATLLPRGQVLVAGGISCQGCTAQATAEVYNPRTGTWTPTGSMAYPHSGATATRLLTGQVIVAGGYSADCNCAAQAHADLYNPRTGRWTATGNLTTARGFHSATLLPSGQVLVAGGGTGNCCPGTILASAESYHPATGTWTPTGAMVAARASQTATLLSTGEVLVAGGSDSYGNGLASAELYDPQTGAWHETGSLSQPRTGHAAVLLKSGMVLAAGGQTNPSSLLASAEVYNPQTRTWIGTASMSTARTAFRAVLLPRGRALVMGGYEPANALATAELYHP